MPAFDNYEFDSGDHVEVTWRDGEGPLETVVGTVTGIAESGGEVIVSDEADGVGAGREFEIVADGAEGHVGENVVAVDRDVHVRGVRRKVCDADVRFVDPREVAVRLGDLIHVKFV
jgi:hypothetical protein